MGLMTLSEDGHLGPKAFLSTEMSTGQNSL